METKIIILRTPLTESALSIVFGYRAEFYDLDSYGPVDPTFPERLLKMYLSELDHLAQINRGLKRLG